METMKLSKNEADAYVLNILKANIDCSDALSIITSIDGNKVYYELEDEIEYQEIKHKRLTPLSYLEYIMLLKQTLAEKGYTNAFIKPIVRKEIIKYEVPFHLYEKRISRGLRK